MYHYILYRIGQFIALRLPLKLAYKLAVLASDVHYLFADKDRASVTANLKTIFPDKSKKEIAVISRRMFRNFAKYLTDFFRLSKLDKEFIKNNIRIENQHYLSQSLSKGKGVIAFTAHIGNWELGGAVIALLGYPFYAVALPHKHPSVNRFFNRQRQAKGVKVIPFGRAVRQCLDALKEGGIVALLGDRDFSEKGLMAQFLGRATFLPVGAAAFSVKTGAIILPGFMMREKDDKFFLRFEQPIEYAPTKNHEEDLAEVVRKGKAVLEKYIRQYPDQWYMFRKFWVDNGR